MNSVKVNMKKCKICGKSFNPFNTFQKTCSPSCAIEFGKQKAKKDIQSERRRAIKALNESDITYLKKQARYWCHKYIRLRDKGKGCISCGKPLKGVFHAGHYKPDGTNAIVRYSEDNINGQCIQCNTYKSGNLTPYRANLIDRIGEARVKHIEAICKMPKKYNLQELRDIASKYKKKAKELENGKI